MAQVEAHTATYFLFVSAATDRPSKTARRSYKLWYQVEITSGKRRDPAHDFTVKLSLSICSHYGCLQCLGWRNVTACMWFVPTFGEDIGSYYIHYQVCLITTNSNNPAVCQ